MDRMLLYAGGLLLLLTLATIRELLPTRPTPEIPPNPAEVLSDVEMATNSLLMGSPDGHGGALVMGEPTTVAADSVAFEEPLPPFTHVRGHDSTFHRGVCLGIFPYKTERPRYLKDLREIKALGANSVSLNFNWFMNTIRDANAYRGVAGPYNQTASDEILAKAIDDAHSVGLKVMLFPSIYVMRLHEGEWRGRITPPDWEVWFASYRSLVVSLARLAEVHAVDDLCIGIELISTEHFNAEWERIINEVRAVYKGRVLYSVNWDARETHAWFSKLDAIAMNAYYELTENKDATVEELVAAWKKIRAEIQPWREAHKLPLIISELGYCSIDGAVTKPWNYLLRGSVDVEEQRRAYEAFFQAWAGDDLFQGVYMYQWHGAGGPNDRSYTPRGKPAAETLRKWFATIAAKR